MGCPTTVTAHEARVLESSTSGSTILSDLLPNAVEPPKCLKRSRACHDALEEDEDDAFDMSPLFQATLPVENSMEFPTIEWNFDLDNDDHVETPIEASWSIPPPSKRRCGGMVRCMRIESGLDKLGLESTDTMCDLNGSRHK